MKVARYVADFLAAAGVGHVFEMAGGAIAHLLDAVHEHPRLEAVSMHHEQAAAFAAEGYARARAGSGGIGVAMATSGPGALNLLTGIGSCYFDSIPALFITGQVNTYEFKFDAPVRQNGFQETDIVSVAKPITKHAELVTQAEDIRFALERALHLARTGRPGPVLLDLPMDVQRAEVVPERLRSYWAGEEFKRYREEQAELSRGAAEGAEQAMKLLLAAKRPLVLIGGGVRSGGAVEALREWLELTKLPSVASLLGLDALPADWPHFLGLIGTYGHRQANLAVANSDFLLVLGSRLDTRQTGTRPEWFAREAKVIHVDIDANELGRKVRTELPVHADVGRFLKQLSARWTEPDGEKASACWEPWRIHLQANRSLLKERLEGEVPHPTLLLKSLAAHLREDDLICLDVGQHQMWASQSLRLREGQRLLNAGGMGAMGFALPAAIGAALASPGRRLVVIAGDGGLQVNIQELETMVRLRLPLLLLVLNNRSLGMVRQFQDQNFEGRLGSTVQGYGCPDLVHLAEAYGLPSRRATAAEVLEKGWAGLTDVGLLEIEVSGSADVVPKLGVNKPPEDMDPPLPGELLRRLLEVNPINE
ncbi:thiamine pyrophosphate-binding protein [Cohnella sp. AR92]|nr:thiamine pyrophosphate-binding protein [Cohnella sp. AR92]